MTEGGPTLYVGRTSEFQTQKATEAMGLLR